MLILSVVLCVMALTWTALNVVYSRKVGNYTEQLRRGLVRVKVRYKGVKGVKTLKGWSYRVDLTSVLGDPVRCSSAFIKVYVKGTEVTTVAFSTVEKLDVKRDSYISVILSQKVYL